MGQTLSGIKIVLTGEFDAFKRKEAQTKLEQLGADVTGSVSSKTRAVIAGRDAGSKLDKARELGLPILDEAQLLRLLAGESFDAVALNAAGESASAKPAAEPTTAPAAKPAQEVPQAQATTRTRTAVPQVSASTPTTQDAASTAALLAAVRAGKLEEVERALDAGASLEMCDERGVPLALVAAERCQDDIVRRLLERGAALDTTSTKGTPMLSPAVAGGMPWLIERCLAAGQRIDVRRPDGVHLYEIAFARWAVLWPWEKPGEKLERLFTCLDLLAQAGHGFDVCAIDGPSDVPGNPQVTLLAAAVLSGNGLVVHKLLALGASPTFGPFSAQHAALLRWPYSSQSAPVTSADWMDAVLAPGIADTLAEAAIARAVERKAENVLAWLADSVLAGTRHEASARAAIEGLRGSPARLIEAISDGDVAACEALLDSGVPTNVEVAFEAWPGLFEDGREGTVSLTPLAVAELGKDEAILEMFDARGLVLPAEAELLKAGIPHRVAAAVPGFEERTLALLVVGTARGDVEPEHWERYRDLALKWSSATGEPIVAVPAGGELEYAAGPGTVVVGFEVARADADDIAGLVPASALTPGALAARLPRDFWRELADLDAELGVAVSRELSADEEDALDAIEDAAARDAARADSMERAAAPCLYLTCAGPLPYASLVYGELAGPAHARRLGRKLLTGQGSNQEPHRHGVAGIKLTFVQQESPELRRIDLTGPSIRKRTQELGDGQFYLIARYD